MNKRDKIFLFILVSAVIIVTGLISNSWIFNINRTKTLERVTVVALSDKGDVLLTREGDTDVKLKGYLAKGLRGELKSKHIYDLEVIWKTPTKWFIVSNIKDIPFEVTGVLREWSE